MTPEIIEREREAFEEWYINYLPPDSPIQYFSRDYTGYRTYRTRVLFEGWLARAAQSEWISVKDRLPESSKRYLTFSSFYMQVITAYYSVDRRMWLGVCRAGEITHWQPLPAPPTTAPPRNAALILERKNDSI